MLLNLATPHLVPKPWMLNLATLHLAPKPGLLNLATSDFEGQPLGAEVSNGGMKVDGAFRQPLLMGSPKLEFLFDANDDVDHETTAEGEHPTG